MKVELSFIENSSEWRQEREKSKKEMTIPTRSFVCVLDLVNICSKWVVIF